MYRRSFSVSVRDEIYASLAASMIAMLPAAVIYVLLPAFWPLRHALVLMILLAAVGVSFSRLSLRVLRVKMLPQTARRIAVVGSPERVLELPDELSLSPNDQILRLPIEGFDDGLHGGGGESDPVTFDWLQNTFAWNADTLIVTDPLPPQVVPALLRLTEAHGVKLAFAPMRMRPHAYDFRVYRDGGLALIYPRTLQICTPGAEFFRRVMDLAVAVPAGILLAPVMLAVAAAVVVDSGWPVIYRQRRVGRLGKEFDILKFRTMRIDAEKHTGPTWAKANESRVTRIGKFLRRYSLDELPQLFNVLAGSMSVVGPRPERPFYVDQFRTMLPRYDERLLVRPGITGWAQIQMRRQLDLTAVGEKLSNDIFYLEHWSIFLDGMIILKTAAEFLFHRAA
jgi:exopolysaccharide biosynthesis polyprenyl glycosylphosphotransferase